MQFVNNDFFVHFISLYINSFPRQNKVFGGLEIVSAFGRALKFAQCDEKRGLAKKCTSSGCGLYLVAVYKSIN